MQMQTTVATIPFDHPCHPVGAKRARLGWGQRVFARKLQVSKVWLIFALRTDCSNDRPNDLTSTVFIRLEILRHSQTDCSYDLGLQSPVTATCDLSSYDLRL
jgi:hypothetical protein